MVMTDKISAIYEAVEAHTLDQTGHALRVTVIRGGTSVNGYFYNERALQDIARLIEGAQAYTNHDTSSTTRSVRDIIGFYQDAIYVPPLSGEAHGRVDATLHILEAADWLWSIIQESFTIGRPDLIGLSIDIFGRWQVNESTGAKDVTLIQSLNSCDVVTRPSAGGSFNRIIHGVEAQNKQLDRTSGGTMDTQNRTSQVDPQQIVEQSQLEAQIRIREQLQQLETQRQEVELMMRQTRLDRAQLLLERRLLESILPLAVKDQIRERYAQQVFEEADLERDLVSAHNMMARLSKDGIVHGNGYEKSEISSQITEAEKIQAAFDQMFGLETASKFGNIKGFSSLREAYARVTGDSTLSSGISEATQLGVIQVSERAPLVRVSEADTTTASFSYLLGTSMNKRLLKDYQSWDAEWMKFVSIVPIPDFKQQSRVRMGAFNSLPIVAEDTAYTTASLTDSAATYVPQKRGNLVTISRETIINDDLQAIKQIPFKLANAAAHTLAEFVYAFLMNNPVIYDGNDLFLSGAPHHNLGNSALSTAAMQAGITAMREQTNFAGKRLGLRPRFLIVPPELEWVSRVMTQSPNLPGSPNNDINPMQGYLTPIVAPQLTDNAQWFLVGDPREIDTIELGFVGGQVNPSLFIQDNPTAGLNFTQDAVSYKIRHEYGGCVVDYRGLYRGI